MVDFKRINYVRHALERDPNLEPVVVAPAPYVRAALDILELPVAAWDCPTTAAGEIDTERKRNMSWNQQGNGNGYGQPQQQQGYVGGDTYDRLNNTKPVGGARFPFIEGGTHRFAIVTLEEFQHSADGPSARALVEVISSTNAAHPPGSYAVKIWKLVKPGKFPNQATDADQFADFCRKLKGAPENYPIGNDIRVLMKERAREQLARGTVIECTGVPNKKGNYVNVYWKAVQQSPQDIATQRARIEAKGVPDTGSGNAQPPAAPQYQAPPQQPQYQQPMQQAPVAAPQGGYPMQNPVPQQQPYPGTPVNAPAAPQGGFLAQLPPQGNGPQGGNTGGGW